MHDAVGLIFNLGEQDMKVKAGRYTLGITMIAAGVLSLMNLYNGKDFMGDLWKYSPVVLILFGLEVILLNLIYSRKEDIKVEVSGGSLVLVLFVVAFFMVITNRLDIHQPFLQEFIRM